MDYARVIKDFASGEIDKEKWCLYVDNDGGYWQSPDHDAPASEVRKMDKRYGTPGGYCDVVEILHAAGVNAEWV